MTPHWQWMHARRWSCAELGSTSFCTFCGAFPHTLTRKQQPRHTRTVLVSLPCVGLIFHGAVLEFKVVETESLWLVMADSCKNRVMAGAGGTLDTAFPFLSFNEREAKPRKQGITEIRGPYYTPLGLRMLSDVLDLAGQHVDCVKFAGGSFSIMPEAAVRNITKLCHQHQVKVSTGGFLERVLASAAGPSNVVKYMETVKDLGFDILEISTGFVALPLRDWQKLIEDAQEVGLTPKPEVGIQFGAGGTSSVASLAAEGTRDAKQLIKTCQAFLQQNVELIMIESEGITEQVATWRTDVISSIMSEIGPEHVMFEAAEPDVFSWYVKTWGPEVNLFIDHSQILQLECLRRGVWGTNDTWGRICTYKGGRRGTEAPAGGAAHVPRAAVPREVRLGDGE